MKLSGKWMVVTGASSGFGAAAATLFAREGARVILGARREERLRKLADALNHEHPGSAHFHALDVGDSESVNRFLRWTMTFTARVDWVINNAGGAHGLDPVATVRDDDIEAMVQSNLVGVVRMCRAFLPLLPHHAGAGIINIGSIAGRTAYEGGAVYCGVKAAELKITQSLRLELNGTGIRVGTLDPGLSETEFSLVRFKGDEARSKAVYNGTFPLVAPDIAEALLFMVSRPAHVCIDEIVIKPTDQAAIHKLHRRPN